MDTLNLEELYTTYKQAVDAWVEAIRTEEALASPDPAQETLGAWELWDQADNKVQDAEDVAMAARDAYKDALREMHYGF